MHLPAAERRRALSAGETARLTQALKDEVVAAIPLVGGLDTASYRLDMRGEDARMVLHRYQGWEPERAMARVKHERALLGAIGPLYRWAPRVVLSDPAGEMLGEPASVLTYIPGAPAPPPQDGDRSARDRWIGDFVRPLVELHRIPLDILPTDLRADDPDGGLASLEREAHGDDLSRSLLKELHRRLPLLPSRRVLLHHDYWFGNTIWSDGSLTGVIDWISARIGDPQKDLALARSDVAVTLDPRAADEVSDRYRHLGGETGSFVYWDLLFGLMAYRWVEDWHRGWVELGAAISLETARERAIAFAENALRAAVTS